MMMMENRNFLDRKRIIMINAVLLCAVISLQKRLERDDNFMKICTKEQHRIIKSEFFFFPTLTVNHQQVANPKTLRALAKDTILDFVLKTIMSQCKEQTRVLQERVVKMRDLQTKYLQYLQYINKIQSDTLMQRPFFLRSEIWQLEQFICDRKYFCIKQELFKVRYDDYNRRLRMRTWGVTNDQEGSPKETPVYIDNRLITDLLGKIFVRSPKLTKKENIWFNKLFNTLLRRSVALSFRRK
ncbi:hypothetical protein KR074_008411 [Drosophila pseudoananassae]|nr:hypothetical protein KR074_008411 [Drosophila pseudoananassae]